MKHIFKRSLPFVLILMMIFTTALPSAVFATETEPTYAAQAGLDETPTADTGGGISATNANTPPPADATKVGQLDILSVTDFHGNLVNDGTYGENAVAEVLAKNIEDIYAGAKTATTPSYKEDVLFIASGDMYQGTALSNMLQGKPVNDLFSYLNMDVMALGNHEFDWSLAVLDSVTHQSSGYDIIAANLRYANTWPEVEKRGKRVYPAYETFEKAGLKIAVIGGLLSNAGPVISATMWKDMEFTNLADEAYEVARELDATGEYDLIIGAFHTGVSECKRVADKCGNLVDLYLAGHTHSQDSTEYTISSTGKKVPILIANYNGRGYINFPVEVYKKDAETFVKIPEIVASSNYYKNLHTTWNSGGYQIQRTGSSPNYIYNPVPDSMRSATAAAIVAAAKEKVGPIANEVLSHSSVDLVRASGGDYFLQNWATDALLNAVPDAKVSFMNSGGLRVDLVAGNVTVGNMYSLMPFDNAIYKLETDKTGLKAIIEQAIGGGVTGTLPFAGIKYTYNTSKAVGNRVQDITWADGSYINSTEKFYILVPDFVATGGDNYTSFKNLGLLHYDEAGEVTNITGVLLRDAFIDDLRKRGADVEMGTLAEHESRRTTTTASGDFTRLNNALTSFAAIESREADYTVGSWAKLTAAVTKGKAAVSAGTISTIDANFIADEIWAAIKDLGLATFELAVLTTTDMHGRIYNINPLNDATVHNSFLKAATVIKQQRPLYDGSLLVDVGDIIQGTAMTSYNVNVENGDSNPMAVCLRYIGYDAFVPGNHEYNYTIDVQQKFYDLLTKKSSELQERPANRSDEVQNVIDTTDPVPAVAANILSSEVALFEDPKENFKPYVIKEYTVGAKTFKVGILGFENVNVPNWDPRSHYPDTMFSHKDNIDQSYQYEWEKYWMHELKDVEKADIVIVAAHSGFGSTSYNKENQLQHFIAHTNGVDIVIGGHDHSARNTTVDNKDGVPVPFLNAGTSNVTKEVITLKEDGTFKLSAPSQIALNSSVQNDATLQSVMKSYYDKSVVFVNAPIGTLSAIDGAWDNVNNFFTGQGDGYDLVNEAQLWAADADVSISSDVHRNNFYPGSLFTGGAETASISLKKMYDLYQYDNNLLYGIYMSGPELLSWMEETAKYYSINGSGNVAGSGFGLDAFYGIDYEVYVREPVGQRIKNATYKGAPLSEHTKADIKVAVNSYRLSASAGNDSYGWFKATGLNTDSDRVYFIAAETEEFGIVGGSVTLMIGEYIKAMGVLKPPRIESTSGNYSTWRATTQPWLADYTKLNSALAAYEEIKANAASYTAGSWATLLAAATKGQAATSVNTIGTAQLDALADAINTAISGLKLRAPASILAVLTFTIQDAERQIDQSLYTDASLTDYKAALAAAKEILDDPSNSTTDDVMDAAFALVDAMETLVLNANKFTLKSYIDYAKELIKDKDKYIPVSIENLQEKLTAATTVYDNNTATQAAVDAAAKALMEAISTTYVKGDKAALQAIYNLVSRYAKDTYTPASWEVFDAAMKAAKKVLDNPNATDTMVDQAYGDLTTATTGLTRRANFTALNASIQLAQSIVDNIGDYIPSTVVGLAAELASVKLVADNQNATQAEVNAAATSLNAKILAARLKPDMSGLIKSMQTAGTFITAAYTANSVSKLTKAMTAGNALLSSPLEQVKQAAVDTATSNINAAIAGLVKRANTVSGADAAGNTGDAAVEITVPVIKIASLSAGNKRVVVKWKKAPAAAKVVAYQIQYRVKGAAKWKTRTISANKATLTIKELKKGKRYQVRIRAYQTVSGKKYYAAWSAVKTSKTLK